MSDQTSLPAEPVSACVKAHHSQEALSDWVSASPAFANNFRDVANGLGGAPYTSTSGQRLRTGMFYRSSVLALQALDAPAWDALDVSTVYDLRTPSEVSNQPNPLPEGVTYQHINVLNMDHVMFGSLTSARDTVAFMEALQRKMVTDPHIRNGLATVLTQLAENPGAQIYHCSAGKDRTGWISVLLLSHAGVAADVIMEDYLLSNQRLSTFIEHTQDVVAERYGAVAAAAIRPALSVQESFLQAGLDQVTQSYGSMLHYLRDGLGMTITQLEQLQQKLLKTADT